MSVENIADLIRLARPRQWVKNCFIFFPLIFSGHFADQGLLLRALWVFAAFSLTASSVYIANDILDVARDRYHPKKSQRPLVTHRVGVVWAVAMSASFCISGLAIAYLLGWEVNMIILGYLLIHIIYNFYAKNVVLLDGFLIGIGFLLRVWAGAYAVGVIPSEWLVLCIFLLALFLIFAKRRFELSTLKEKAVDHRGVLAHYTPYLLDQIIIICSTLTIVFYGLYAISPDVLRRVGYGMVYSLLFVIYGIFRYLYLIHVKKLGGDPGDVFLSDRPLFWNTVLWIVLVFFIIYRS